MPATTTNLRHWRSPHGRVLPVIGGRTLIMGVLNLTPDSFSDGGQLGTVADAVDRARAMLAAGADVLDVGGESTRPGARPVTTAEEQARVLPVIRALRAEWPDAPLSIDTYKAEVASAALEAGADLINDIWGAAHGLDPAVRRAWRDAADDAEVELPVTPMAAMAAKWDCPIILMHNRPDRAYGDFWRDVIRDLALSCALARRAGCAAGQLWVDPGFGFAKDPPHNLEVLRELHRLRALGHPVLLGTSRKSTIGLVLDAPVERREAGTAATLAWGIQQGCAMVRVHDVAAVRDVVRMADAIRVGLDWRAS